MSIGIIALVPGRSPSLTEICHGPGWMLSMDLVVLCLRNPLCGHKHFLSKQPTIVQIENFQVSLSCRVNSFMVDALWSHLVTSVTVTDIM